MKRLIYKTMVIVLVMTLIFSLTAAFYGCTRKEKKAIVLIHGICGGALYDDNGQAVWAMDMIDTSELTALLTDPYGLIDKMSLDEDGKSPYNLRPADMNDERGRYTMLSMFEPLQDALSEEFSDEYEVVVWQYDWRLDNLYSAKKLDQFIQSKGYDKIVFVTHSMGGNVVSQYLADNEKNKAKVELFIPLSTPFFGSIEAYYFLTEGLFSNVGGLLNSVPMEQGRVDFSPYYTGIIPNLVNGIKPLLKELGGNLPSLYMLSPFEEYSADPEYATGETPVRIDGVYITHTDAHEYFKGLDIAKKKDNSPKPGFELYKAYQAGHLVEIDGKLKHISNTVNTHYIVGYGIKTLKTLDINTETGRVQGIEQNLWGDGVVSIYSGTAGNPKDAANVYILEGSSHLSITTDQQCVDKVVEIIRLFRRPKGQRK